MAQRLKRLPTMRKTQVRYLGREDPQEKEMVTHSSILAWRILWTEKPGRLPSIGSQRVGDPSLIPGSGRSPGEENGNTLQYSCLENRWTEETSGLHSVHRVAKSQTRLSDFIFTFKENTISNAC